MGWLDRMILRTKLLLLSTVLLIGLIAVGVVGYLGISQWAADMERSAPIAFRCFWRLATSTANGWRSVPKR